MVDSSKRITGLTKHLVDDKQVIGRSRKAAILSVSEGQAVMETEEEIFTCDNLKLDVGDGLYALVTHTENDLTTIRFTARPAGFGQWLEQIGFREPTDNGDYAGLETGGKNHTDEQ